MRLQELIKKLQAYADTNGNPRVVVEEDYGEWTTNHYLVGDVSPVMIDTDNAPDDIDDDELEELKNSDSFIIDSYFTEDVIVIKANWSDKLLTEHNL